VTVCVTCEEAECACPKETAPVISSSAGRICVFCGARAERSDAKFCVTCGKTMVPPPPPSAAAARPWAGKKNVVAREELGRNSFKKRHCSACGEDSETNGAQCPLCKEWF
jgi:predicted amidophosphoribosyltransferase